MKKRTSFVSNSSSSSFILATKKENTELKMTLEITIDLNDYSDDIVKTEAELHDYYYKEWENDDYKNSESFQTAREELNQGNILIMGTVSSDDGDNPISQMLYTRGFPKNIKDYKMIYEGN